MTLRAFGERGPRLLLLPGLGARGQGYWRLAERLATIARPILVEYPIGRQAAVGSKSLAAEVLEASGEVEGVVASSMGGLVAAHMAAQGALRGVAFIGSFSRLSELELRGRLFALMGPVALFGRPGWGAASIAAWRLVPGAEVADIVPTTWAERVGVWHRAWHLSREAPAPSLPPGLEYVAMHGSRDLLVPVEVLTRLGSSLPAGTALHVLPGAGHVPYWSHPDEVFELLRPWVKRVEAQRG